MYRHSLKSHSDVVMVAKEGSASSKSHSDGVLIKKDNLEHSIPVMANVPAQQNRQVVFLAKEIGGFIAGIMRIYVNCMMHKKTSSLQDFCLWALTILP